MSARYEPLETSLTLLARFLLGLPFGSSKEVLGEGLRQRLGDPIEGGLKRERRGFKAQLLCGTITHGGASFFGQFSSN